MANVKREKTNLEWVATALLVHERTAGQTWYQTSVAYELWQDEPLQLVKRVSRKVVYFIGEKKLSEPLDRRACALEEEQTSGGN